MSGIVIALLGAESTGKTQLARQLALHFQRSGVPATLVSEYLREWCEREGRTPRPDEQAAIADTQTRRIAEAARQGVVVADTTALMTAVYSDMLFHDRSLYAAALAAQRGCTLTLLTALDLPWVADGLQRDGPHVREPVDAHLRAALIGAGLGFSVVHGSGDERLQNALNAVDSIAPGARPADASARSDAGPAWRWACDKCSDPDCEHRLFSELVAKR